MKRVITNREEYKLEKGDKNLFIDIFRCKPDSARILIKVDLQLIQLGYTMTFREIVEFWMACSDEVAASFLSFSRFDSAFIERIFVDNKDFDFGHIEESTMTINECLDEILTITDILDKLSEYSLQNQINSYEKDIVAKAELIYMKTLGDLFEKNLM